jgi:hypothetical protein
MADVMESRQQRIVEAVKRKIKSDPSRVAQHLGVPSGLVKKSKRQECLDYWTPDPNVLNNAEEVMKTAAETAFKTAKEGESPEDTIMRATGIFVHQLYPARMDLIRSGARGLSVKEQVAFSDEMEKLGPPGEEEGE